MKITRRIVPFFAAFVLFALPMIVFAQKPVERIYHAWYGIEDGAKVENAELVDKVRIRLQNGLLSVSGDMNSLFGDPAPGRVKKLAIYVKYTDGSEAHLRAVE